MPPPDHITPGPNLPLLRYWHDLLPVGEVDYKELTRGLYRLFVRCYALELYPWEIMSVNEWEAARAETIDGVTLRKTIATGARFKVRGMSMRSDFYARFIMEARHKFRCTSRSSAAWVPWGVIPFSLYNLTFYRAHSPEERYEAIEFNLYRVKVAYVYHRLRTMGFHHLIKKSDHNGAVWRRRPNLLQGFTACHPGAVVKTEDGRMGWVTREVAPDVVTVEFENGRLLHKEACTTNELVVLG